MLAAGKFARRIDRASGIVLITPAPDGIEVLQAEPDGVEDFVAVGANGVRAMQFGALAQGQVRDCF